MARILKKNTFHESLKIQFRVIGALLMREILTKYGRHNIGFMWIFVEPMLFVLGVTALWSFVRSGHAHGISVISFALTGYSSVLLWRNAVNSCAGAITANLTLLYHRNIHILDLYFARLLLNLTGTTIAFIFLMIFFILIEVMVLPKDLLLMFEGWFLLVWFAVSLGFVIGSLIEMSKFIDRMWHTVSYLMFPLSGALFMLDWMPENVREILLWIPMVHATEMIRGGYYGDIIPTYYDPFYLICINIVLLFCGLLLVKQIQQKIIP